jgi:hypothetical protein
MNEDAFQSVLLPILRELEGVLDHLVLIGGWVPELHRRFGGSEEWRVKPLATIELDVFLKETWQDLSTVRTLDLESRLGGILLGDLGVLRDRSVALRVPLESREDGSPGEYVSVQVPQLGAFLVHKGAIFRRRPDLDKQAKDLHYIVDVMQSGEAQVEKVEKEIEGYCREGGGIAELARQARNHLGVVIGGAPGTELRNRLASGIAVRHRLPMVAADARAVGFLSDFRDLIPEDCGDSG